MCLRPYTYVAAQEMWGWIDFIQQFPPHDLLLQTKIVRE